MGTRARAFITPEEYLERERKAEYKSEYWNGQVFAMSGATPRHAIIVKNLTVALDQQIWRKGCIVFGNDLRVRVRTQNFFTYPDVSVVCGKQTFDYGKLDVTVNPVLIAEVLSPTTERYDRVAKFTMYSAIESLREYVLISQSEFHVERHLRRAAGNWAMTEACGLRGSIKLTSVPAVLKLRDLYRQVDLS